MLRKLDTSRARMHGIIMKGRQRSRLVVVGVKTILYGVSFLRDGNEKVFLSGLG
jgi:hypothetical protein